MLVRLRSAFYKLVSNAIETPNRSNRTILDGLIRFSSCRYGGAQKQVFAQIQMSHHSRSSLFGAPLSLRKGRRRGDRQVRSSWMLTLTLLLAAALLIDFAPAKEA